MEKYRIVQNAYLHIKSNTNIVELGKILARMERQDEEYEGLLKKVGALEGELTSIETGMNQITKR